MSFQRSFPLTNRKPGEIIAHGPDGELSVGQFLARAIKLADQIPDHRYVINLIADRYEFFLGFCAAVVAGQCTLMPSNRQQQTVQQVARDYADCYLLGDSTVPGVERFDTDLDALTCQSDCTIIPDIPAHQLCAIAFTSGSTGAAMPNRKYWRTLRNGALSNVELLIEDQGTRLNLLATVPAQHMWGFETSIMLPLFCNIAVSRITPFFPQDIVDAADSLPEPRGLVSSPLHLNALLSAKVAQPRIDRIFSATAPMSTELAQQLEQRFNARVSEIFGCTEAGTFATRDRATESLWRLSDTFDLKVGEGKVVIRAAHLPEDVVLQDVVELVDAEHFRWLGRNQDMINIAGKRGSLAHLNHRLTAIPGVVDGVIFLPDDNSKRLAALVVAPGMQPSDILQQLRLGIEPAFLPRPMYNVAMLPRHETGKLVRIKLIELFEQTRRSRIRQNEGATDSETG